MEQTDTTLYNDILHRRRRLQEYLQKMDIDACVICTNVNLFYLTGLIYTGFLFVPAQGEPIHFIKNAGTSLPQGIVEKIRKPEQIADILSQHNLALPRNILLETDTLPYNLAQRILNSFQHPSVENASVLMRQIRSIKSDYEITQIKSCAQKHISVYKIIPDLYKKGMSDLQLQIEIEHQMRLHGSIGLFRTYGENMEIFMGSLLAGNNAQNPSPFDFALGGAGANNIAPLGANGTILCEGMSIMVDMAGNYSPWTTDMTRVFSIGKISETAYKAHQTSIEIHQDIVHHFKTGMPCNELWQKALKLVEKNQLLPYFMGTTSQAKFVGHGVGLEINEPPVITPRSQEILQQNMVFALEPKFVIPNVGAVGIENTYLVTSSGLENITPFTEEIIPLG